MNTQSNKRKIKKSIQPETKEEAMKLNKTVMPKTEDEQTKEGGIPDYVKKILEDPFLLLNIVREVQAEGVKGEEDSIVVLIGKVTLRLVPDAKPTSSNVVLSDEPGGGKDVLVIAVCRVLIPEEKYDHRTRLSERALDYWGTNKGEDWTWTGRVLYLEDPGEDLLKSQTFKVLSSGKNLISTVKDQKLLDLILKGKPVIIVTSLKASIDEEGGRRWDAMRVDTSNELTKQVIHGALAYFQGEEVKKRPNKGLRDAIQKYLKSYEVVFLNANELEEFFSTNLVMRTQVHKLIDYIKASAILHQYQRKKDKIGRLIATWEDYEYARFVFQHLKDEEGTMLNKDEEEFLKILKDANQPLKITEIATKYKRHTESWIYAHIDSFKTKGLIGEKYEKEESGAVTREIKKLYAINNFTKKGLPDKHVFLRFIEKAENEQQEGSLRSIGFIDICKEIDNQRKKSNLKPVFAHFYNRPDENEENEENQSVDGFIIDENNQEKLDQITELRLLKELFGSNHELSEKTVIAFVTRQLHKKKPDEYISILLRKGILTSLRRGKLSFTG